MSFKAFIVLLWLPVLALAQVAHFVPREPVAIGAQGIRISAPYESEAAAYFLRAGVTDPAAKQQINDFVKGLKTMGLWSGMVCWPMRSAQNAGSGVTVFSLGGLGTYDGTLVNGPVWSGTGISFAQATSQRMAATTATSSPTSYIVGAVFNPSTSGTGSPSSVTIAHNGTSNADAIEINDTSPNILTGSHRQAAGGTIVAPANQAYVTGVFQVVQMGWTGATVRRVVNRTSEATTSSAAFGGFVSPFTVNCRADNNATVGNDKVVSFAYMLQGKGASLATCQAIYDLYKSTLGQGLGLP